MRPNLFLIALAFLTAAPALAAPHAERIPALPPIVATYDVYVGGVHLVTSDILFQEQGNKYHTKVTAQTYGFWHRALPWETTLDSKGKIVHNEFVPTEFYTRDVWKDKPKVTKLHFTKNGDVVPEFDPPNTDDPNKRDTVTEDQRRGALDPITALLQMMAHVSMQKDCDVTVGVFDGKRRFDVNGVSSGTDEIDEDDYGVYKGPARLCDADFKMISGEWKDRKPTKFWQLNEKGEAGREPFHIWLANISQELPEMPVRLETGSVFGLVVVHLTHWRHATSAEMKS